jgi:hypothetical protein
MATLSNQVHDGPVVFAPLQEVKGQFGQFSAAEPAAQQNGKNSLIALTFQCLCSW